MLTNGLTILPRASESRSMTPDHAQEIATEALIWLATRPDALGPFLAASGLAPPDLRARAADPEFLGFVLDFLLQGDTHLLAFCAATGHAHTTPLAARAALPGGTLPNWT